MLAARGDVCVVEESAAACLLYPSPESDCPGMGDGGGLVLTDGVFYCVDPFLLWLGERGTTLSVDS